MEIEIDINILYKDKYFQDSTWLYHSINQVFYNIMKIKDFYLRFKHPESIKCIPFANYISIPGNKHYLSICSNIKDEDDENISHKQNICNVFNDLCNKIKGGTLSDKDLELMNFTTCPIKFFDINTYFTMIIKEPIDINISLNEIYKLFFFNEKTDMTNFKIFLYNVEQNNYKNIHLKYGIARMGEYYLLHGMWVNTKIESIIPTPCNCLTSEICLAHPFTVRNALKLSYSK